MLVETWKSTSSTDCLEKVLHDLGLLHSKQMSDLATIDSLNTTSNLESTRSVLKTLNTRITHYKIFDYAMSEHDQWIGRQKLSLPTSHQ